MFNIHPAYAVIFAVIATIIAVTIMVTFGINHTNPMFN